MYNSKKTYRCAIGSLVVLLMAILAKSANGGTQLSSDSAKQVIDQLAARIQRIETIDLRFSLRFEHFHEAADLDPARRPNYVLDAGRYIYDGQSDSTFWKAEDSRRPGTSVTAVSKSGIFRSLTIDGAGAAEGLISNTPNLTLSADGPEHFLRISRLRWMVNSQLEGTYLLEHADGKPGDVRLTVGRFGEVIAKQSGGIHEVYSLAPDKGFAPYRVEAYIDGQLREHSDFDLAEVEPGLWITTRGVATTLTAFREEPIPFMQRTFEANPESIIVNAQIAAGQFELPFPPETWVRDSINKSFYIEGFKSGQGQRRQVQTFAKHAEIMAPKKPADESDLAPAAGMVVADYGTSWYQSVALWIVVGAVILAVVGFALFRRAG